MQIDWFEIIAQIINFFIILFLLQKLLYKPVVNAMAERQERIQRAQIEAEAKMEEAKKLISEYDEKIADVDSEKREILEEAREQAEKSRDDLLEGYREDAENKRKAYIKEIEDEKEYFISYLSKSLGENAVKIASHILGTISSKRLEEEVFHTFISNLKNLKQDLPDIKVLNEEEHLDVISSRDLSQEEKEKIEIILKGQVENLKTINYEIDEDLVLGFELNLETYTLHTNIKNYLDTIKDDIIKNLETN